MKRSLYYPWSIAWFVFLMGVFLPAQTVVASSDQKPRLTQKEPLLTSPLLTGRAPASANPLLEDTQIYVVQKKEPKTLRWRLLGSCRQDVGMNQSQSGLGYANCRN